MKPAPRVALHDVVAIQREVVDPSRITPGTPFVGLENIATGGGFLNVQPTNAGEIASSKFAFTPEHLLYGKLRPYLAKVARPDFEGICSTDILPLLPGPNIDRGYLAWILLAPEMVSLASSRASGANLPRLSPKALGELRIPLPPLPEQRRIATILDRADELRTKRRATLAKLDTLIESIFLEMFGDPATNPKGWPVAPLGRRTQKIGSGATPLGGRAAYSSSGTAFIRSMNVRDGMFCSDGLAFIDDTQAAALNGVTVEANDVLLNITGASVARVCRAPAAVLPARVNQHVSIVRPTNDLDARFLESCLLQPSMKRRLLLIARAGGATREAITKDAIERLELIEPPQDLQNSFSALIGLVEREEALQQSHLRAGEALFTSLQYRAFHGEL